MLEIERRLILISIGKKKLPGTDGIGGDTTLLKAGYTVELVDLQGDSEDGGPVSLCVCPDVDTAQRIRHALELTAKL
jgi:hypothetical protein